MEIVHKYAKYAEYSVTPASDQVRSSLGHSAVEQLTGLNESSDVRTAYVGAEICVRMLRI